MDLKIVHVDGENFGTISCPYCGAKKRVSAEKFKGQQHKFTVRCKCQNHFDVQLNFRRYYRKSVALLGETMISSSNMSDWKEMTVCDLSKSGLRFKMLEPVVIKKGDTLRVRFSFETKQSVLLDKEVVVNFVDGDFFGCEFTDLAMEEKELGFFLFS